MDEALIGGISKYVADGDSKGSIRKLVLEAGYSEAEFETAYTIAKERCKKVPQVDAMRQRVRSTAPETSSQVERSTTPSLPKTLKPASVVRARKHSRHAAIHVVVATGVILLLGAGVIVANFTIVNSEPVAPQPAQVQSAVPEAVRCDDLGNKERQAVAMELSTLRQEMDILHNEKEVLVADFSAYESSDEVPQELQEQLEKVTKRMEVLSARQLELAELYEEIGSTSVDQDQVRRVYGTYCATGSLPGKVATMDVSARTIQSIALTDAEVLFCKLDQDEYADAVVSQALYQAGFYQMLSGEVDQSLDFYRCAAERYYNPTAMYRMARLYAYGTDGILESLEKAKINAGPVTSVRPDTHEAYYWIVAHLWSAEYFDSPHFDSETQLGRSSLALFDNLQAEQSLSDESMVQEEIRAAEFLTPVFPEIISGTSSMYNHSRRAVTEALEPDGSDEAVDTGHDDAVMQGDDQGESLID